MTLRRSVSRRDTYSCSGLSLLVGLLVTTLIYLVAHTPYLCLSMSVLPVMARDTDITVQFPPDTPANARLWSGALSASLHRDHRPSFFAM